MSAAFAGQLSSGLAVSPPRVAVVEEQVASVSEAEAMEAGRAVAETRWLAAWPAWRPAFQPVVLPYRV